MLESFDETMFNAMCEIVSSRDPRNNGFIDEIDAIGKYGNDELLYTICPTINRGKIV